MHFNEAILYEYVNVQLYKLGKSLKLAANCR